MSINNFSEISLSNLPRYRQYSRELSVRWWIAGMFAIGSLVPIGMVLDLGTNIFLTLLLAVSISIMIALVFVSERRLSASESAYKKALEPISKNLLVFAYRNCALELCSKESKLIKETLNRRYPGWSAGSQSGTEAKSS